MAFRILIVEDNHSFIDTLKVMLRDLPLDFSHAYRYNDALNILKKHGVFYIRQDPDAAQASQVDSTGKKKGSASLPLYNENGVFLVIVEQNAETSMKGTDFVMHAIRKFPSLNESDFILITHRLDSVPTRNYGFPVMEKPLRAPQLRQVVLQKIKQAQEITEAQTTAANPAEEPLSTESSKSKPVRKGLRDLLKINRAGSSKPVPAAAKTSKKPKTAKAAPEKGMAAMKARTK